MKIAWLGHWSDVPLFVMFALSALKPIYFAKRTANHILCVVRSSLGGLSKERDIGFVPKPSLEGMW